MIKMMITLFFLVVFSPVVAKQKVKVLFDNTQYQIKCKTSACHSIRIVDKSKGTLRYLIDDINEDMFKLSTTKEDSDINFYASDDNLKMGRYLRLGYTTTGYVSVEEGKEERHVTDSCAIIDLVTAQVKEVYASMGELCYIEDYLSKVSFTPFRKKLAYIENKTFLYKSPNKKTKMYLIKGDKVTLLDKKNDDTGQKWYFINYKGRKDLNMWIKAEAVDVEPVKKPTEKPEPETKQLTPKEPAETTKQTPVTSPSKNADIIKAEKAKPIGQSTSGSTSLTLLASLLGLLAWRVS